MMLLKHVVLGVAVAVMLSACGGGSDGCGATFGGLACDSSPPPNVPPLASAGADQQVLTGASVTLSAAGSVDANQDSLTYAWTLLSKPAGSTAVLSSDVAAKPTFTADQDGTYSFKLVVSDGKSSSIAETRVFASAANVPPVANAGVTQSVMAGSVVTLDGSASSDANPADVLTYAWTLSGPAGTAARLDSASLVRPQFTADVPGTYLASLAVSDGRARSDIVVVRIEAAAVNAVPVANAGKDQSVLVGSLVTLDGIDSSDANRDPLTYSWTLIHKPAGSTAVLDSAAAVRPKFTADKAGDYVFTLSVNDGKASSTNVAAVTVSAGNVAPVANAGVDQTVSLGAAVALDGSRSSDANAGDVLGYQWVLKVKPGGSTAALLTPTAAAASFTPDLVGTYVVTLIVNDGKLDSAPSTVLISVN